MAKAAPAKAASKASPTKGKAAVAEEEAEEEAEEQKPSKYRGLTSGLRVWEFQNQSLEQNEIDKKTDAELAAEWNAEFPNAMDFSANDARMVRHVRNLYNKGKHKNDVPKRPLHGYDENGDPVPNRGEGKKEEAAAVPAPKGKAAAAAPAPVKKVFKKKA